jgi:hypothetical protein
MKVVHDSDSPSDCDSFFLSVKLKENENEFGCARTGPGVQVLSA